MHDLVLHSIFKNKQTFGHNPKLGLKDSKDPSKGKKRILIEFSSPNIAKPFHAGHLRSTIIGGFLSHLYAAAGYEVVKLNYLGDWGKQYGLLALGYEKYGDEKALESNPIAHLFELYVKINAELKTESDEIKSLEEQAAGATKLREEIKTAKESGKDATDLEEQLQKFEEIEAKINKIKTEGLDEQARRYFKAMVDNDQKAIALWRRFRELSIVRYKQAYARLNIEFDEYLGESKVKQESMDAVEAELDAAGLTELSQGAKIINFEKHVPGKVGKGLGKALVKKKDGTSLYLTRDLGAIREREERWHFDQMIYVVASDQGVHLQQLFKLTELSGHPELAARCSHVTFGLVLGMSTRRGTVKFLDDILRDVADKMHEVMKKNETKYAQVENPEAVADILGISSVMVQDMSGKR
jgi:arginyl-tRNA synthetase